MEKGDDDLASVLKSATRKGPLNPVTIKFYWSEMLYAVSDIHEKGRYNELNMVFIHIYPSSLKCGHAVVCCC